MSGDSFTRPDLCSVRAIYGGFLCASRDPVRQFGAAGAWLVTGHRGQRTGGAQ